ncbi:Clp protease N-terminal domain-containing protein [Paractinoplanes globisporus]|uniref:Clp protease N-terminal domain-containing protein n=1 Tax=Paractinoplanes globisporus TaxID=113565 RepID=A0ABW6WCY6_9ACTN|nr:Clp protease N-terminal domain-containing protein [Actinoplanes globisporus]
MFERFTDRARRVIVLAQEEARMFNHNYIGTEHILLGLIHEGEGVAAKALESLGISLDDVRVQIEQIIGVGQQAPSGHIPFTPRAKKVLELTLREALQIGHNYIGTEHILLGLIREGEGVAAQVLEVLGADLNRTRQVVIQLLSGYQGQPTAAPQEPEHVPPSSEYLQPAPPAGEEIPWERFTERSRRVVALAGDEARMLNHNYLGTEHILLGLLHEGEGVGGKALESLGVSLEAVRQLVEEIIGQGMQPPEEEIPITPRGRRVLEFSLREALQIGHNYVGTEHLLLGLIREGEGVACQVLVRLGVDLNRLRHQVLQLLSGYQPPTAPASAPPATSGGGMFERFTDRARRVVVLAQEEARMLNHAEIGTEHFLLGLIHDGEGVATQALESLGISLEDLREQIEEIIGIGAQASPGHLPFTPRARRVLELALREALQLGHTYIGTEHLLLGLIREGEGVAGQVLIRLGADLNRTRQQVIRLLSGNTPAAARPDAAEPAPATSGAPSLDDRARRTVVLAQEEARALNHNYIGTEHILLGLIHDDLAVAIVEGMGIAPPDLRADVEEIIGQGQHAVTGHLPFTPRSKKVLELSLTESRQLGHDYIGSEHLLLALMREGEGVAAQVLARHGGTVERARDLVISGPGDMAAAVVEPPDLSVDEWANWQAASMARNGGPSVELYYGASGLVLLGRSGLHLPLGFVADVLRLTRAGSQPDERLAALHSLPDVQRLRALAWPPPARVGFAALLGAGVPVDPRFTPPAASAAELRSSLRRAVNRARFDGVEVTPAATAEILDSGRRISDGIVTTLLVVGPGAVAADPALPLRLQHGAASVPALSGPQRALLEWSGARAMVPARTRNASTAPGPGLTGISRRGQLTNLLPSQLVLPPAILRHRFADRALLYRLHETETQPPVETVRILLDTSPPTFGSIGVALRIVVQAIVSTLWSARRVPTLVYLDQPGLETPVHKPSDLGLAWTRQSLEPVDLGPVLVAAQRSDQPSVLLTQHRLVADHGIVATEKLRVITTQLPGDDPEAPPEPPFHAHLTAEPTKAQLAAAVRTALAPKAP